MYTRTSPHRKIVVVEEVMSRNNEKSMYYREFLKSGKISVFLKIYLVAACCINGRPPRDSAVQCVTKIIRSINRMFQLNISYSFLGSH